MEPLRMANRVGQGSLYDWTVLTLDGRPAVASNGLSIAPTRASGRSRGRSTWLFVCGGVGCAPTRWDQRLQVGAARGRARRGVALGGLCTGQPTPLAFTRPVWIDGLPMRDPLGEHVGDPGGVPAQRRSRRNCSLSTATVFHLFRRHCADRHDVESDFGERHGKESGDPRSASSFILDRIARTPRTSSNIPLQAQVPAPTNQILIQGLPR